MRRISLDERLGRHQANKAVIDVLVHMSVCDYLRGIKPVNGSSLGAFIRLAEQMKQAGLEVNRAMCKTVVKIARMRDATGDEILYGLLVEPIYKLYKGKEATHEHTVCTQGDGDGPEPDHDDGRSVPTP